MSTRPEAAAGVPAGPPQPGPDVVSRVLRVEHETRYDYEDDVEIAHHLAHLRPRDTDWQRTHGWWLEIDPVPDDTCAVDPDACGAQPAGARSSQDCWGNWRTTFSHAQVHDHLVVRSSFVAEIFARPAPDPASSPPWESVAASLGYRPADGRQPAAEFALPTRLAPRDAALAAFARKTFTPGRPLAQAAIAMMREVFESFEYKPASTSVNTSATESLVQRHGVCQDFAHVMIGAMRSLGLAARYVSGYLLTHPPPGRPRLVGADATHAWMEAWCPANGWISLDPTNGVQPGLDHVTVAWGRDYSDVAPLRGVIRGGGRVSPRVAVTVEPLHERGPLAGNP